MYADMCVNMCTEMCTYACADMCTDMCPNMCANMCTNTCTDMCTDTCADMRTDMCADMCTEVCTYMCRHACGHVYRHGDKKNACRHLYRHVRRHVHRYAHRHACRHLYRHVCRHGYMQTCARAQRRVEPRAPESSAACIMIYGSQHCAGTHSAHPVLCFFLWHAPCKSSSSLMHSTWCMRATQCMPSTRSRSGSARRCDGDREYVPSSTSSRLQSWARRPISAAARDRGQRPRPRSLPRPRLTVNPSYRCDRDRGDFVDGVVPEFCCTWQRIKMQRMEGSVRLDILREYCGNHNLIRRDL